MKALDLNLFSDSITCAQQEDENGDLTTLCTIKVDGQTIELKMPELELSIDSFTCGSTGAENEQRVILKMKIDDNDLC